MLVIISRFKKAVKKSAEGSSEATEQHRDGGAAGTRIGSGDQGVRQARSEQEELSEVSKATVDASLKARRVKAMLSRW